MQELKTAFSLVQEGRIEEAGMIYMELAELGVAAAQLNIALILDKYDLFHSERTMLH